MIRCLQAERLQSSLSQSEMVLNFVDEDYPEFSEVTLSVPRHSCNPFRPSAIYPAERL